MDMKVFAERRARLLSEIGDGVALVPAARQYVRNNDVEHEFRQDSDFYYLTGLDEPECVLVLSNRKDRAQVTLFVRPRNPEREIWDGLRTGAEGAVTRFGADAAYPIAELAERLPGLLENVPRLFFRLGYNRVFDAQVLDAVDAVRGRARAGVRAPTEFVDVSEKLHAARLIKSDHELVAIERAGEVTRQAHLNAMRTARPGVYEYEVEAEILSVFRRSGAERPAYGSIVGSGPNATILHHRRNDRQMQDGDLLLIDAGVELDYYASDVTRTFPVGGRFSEAQRALYDVVLKAQLAAIEAIAPGVPFMEIHDVAVRVLVEGLVDLGLVAGPVQLAIEEERYKPYYMHRTSHFLGMDAHDVGHYMVNGESRPLEPGMVLTVEPGLYVGCSSDAPEAYRGIGIRIEDDIVVTSDGHRVLTPGIPKDPDEVEALLAARDTP